MRFLLITLLHFFACYLSAQPALNKCYGDANPSSGIKVIAEANGYSMACIGYSAFNGWPCIKLYRVDSAGNMLWVKEYGHDKQAWYIWYQAFVKSRDGGYVMVGSVRDSATGHYLGLILKVDSLGNAVFTKVFAGTAGESFTGVTELPDRNIVVSGTTRNGSNYDISLLQLDTLGNVTWRKQYNNSFYDQASHLSVFPNGGFLISGKTTIIPRNYGKNYLIRTNRAGDTLWTKMYGTDGNDDQSTFADVMENGDILIHGYWDYNLPYNAGVYSDYVSRLDSIGNVIWTKLFPDNGHTTINSARQLTTGDILIVGSKTRSTGNSFDGYISLLDMNGNEKWARRLIYTGADVDTTQMKDTYNTFNDFEETTDGGYAIIGTAGYFLTVDVSRSATWLVKTDRKGCIDTDCGFTGINKISNNDNVPKLLLIYPNPATNQITIDCQAVTGDAQWAVHNLLGQQITIGKMLGQSAIKLDVSAYNKGWYMVRIADKDKIFAGKFLVE